MKVLSALFSVLLGSAVLLISYALGCVAYHVATAEPGRDIDRQSCGLNTGDRSNRHESIQTRRCGSRAKASLSEPTPDPAKSGETKTHLLANEQAEAARSAALSGKIPDAPRDKTLFQGKGARCRNDRGRAASCQFGSDQA